MGDDKQTTDDDLPTVAEVRGILKDYPAETEVEAFDCYGLAASLEPGVGLLLELAGDTTWLSWEETCKLAEYLRKVDEWKISHE